MPESLTGREIVTRALEGKQGELIEALLPFGFKTIKQWRKHIKYREIQSEMQWQLVCAIIRIGKDGLKEPEKAWGYLSRAIKRNVLKFLIQDHIVRVPATSQSRNGRKAIYDLPSSFAVSNRTMSGRLSRARQEIEIALSREDIKSKLSELNLKIEDKQILDLKLMSYTDAEIGKLLGVSQQSIQKRVSRLWNKIATELQKT